MITLFRNNQATTSVLLALYVLLLRVPALAGWQTVPEATHLSGIWYDAFLSWLHPNTLVSALVAATIVFIQALFVNYLVDATRLTNDRDWLPGMFYALTASCLSDFGFVSPAMVAATFLPLVMRRIFRTYKLPEARGTIFDAAFWLSVASLFYPPALWLLAAAYIGINMLRVFTVREQAVYVTGAFVPLFLCWLWYFWHDQGGIFWQKQFGNLFEWYAFDLQWGLQTALKSGMLSLLALVVLLSFGIYYHKKLIQIQKYITVLYWFLFVGGLSMLLQREPSATHFLLLAVSVGGMLAMSFQALHNRWIAEIFHLALLGAVLFIQFLPR